MSAAFIHHEDRPVYSVPLHRAVIRDSRLSWGARGLFAFLWDLPSGWSVCVEHLARMSPDGRDAVRSRLKELRSIGAMRIEGVRGESGQLNGRRWVIISPSRWAREFPLSTDDEITEKRKTRFSANPTFGESNTKGLQVFKGLQVEAACPASGNVHPSQQSAASPERKKRRVRESGIVTWVDEDQGQALLIEQTNTQPEISAAVQALLAAGKEPVPGLVQQQIQKQQLVQKKKEQQQAAEAHHAAALARPAEPDLAASAIGQQMIDQVRSSKKSREAAA